MKRGRKAESAPKTREIEVRIISAQDLEDVKRFGKMRTYAVAYIDPDHKVSTQTDEEGGLNPAWNQKLVLQADDELLSQTLAAINVDIYAHSHIWEKLVGTARILISDVLKGGNAADPSDNPVECIGVQVRRPSGRPQGILNLWVPPTGRFLLHRASLSMNRTDDVKILEDDDVDEESVADVTVEQKALEEESLQ